MYPKRWTTARLWLLWLRWFDSIHRTGKMRRRGIPETWDTGDGGYFLATLLGPNITDINPADTKVSVVRTLVADVNLDGTVVPGSMHLIEFAGRDLDVTQFKDYVDQWLAGDLGDTPILAAEYTIGYASTSAFFYQPGKEPKRVTMALQRTTARGKTRTFDML